MQLIETIFFSIFKWFIPLLPKWLLIRIYPHKKILDEIDIDLDSNDGAEIYFSSSISTLNLNFNISNMTALNLIIDRIIIDIWIDQPIEKGVILERYQLSRYSKKKEIRYRAFLSNAQKEHINFSLKRANDGTVRLMLYLLVYFESKIGIIEKNKEIRRDRVAVQGSI